MGRERAGPELAAGPQLRDDLAVAVVLRGTTPSRNCLCTFARRVDAPTAPSTASRRRGHMKTPSPVTFKGIHDTASRTCGSCQYNTTSAFTFERNVTSTFSWDVAQVSKAF